jgi:hypothetical protein
MRITYVLLLLAAIGCEYEHVDPCETRYLENNYLEIASFLDSTDGRFTMVNGNGRVENVRVYREIGSTYVPGSTECWSYRGDQSRLVVYASQFDFGFQCYFSPSINGEILLFEQRINNGGNLEFKYLLGADSLLENHYQTYSNGKPIYVYPNELSVEIIDTLTTSMRPFYGVKIYKNSIKGIPMIPNRSVASLVIDDKFGVIQFTTKSEEIWDVIYE